MCLEFEILMNTFFSEQGLYFLDHKILCSDPAQCTFSKFAQTWIMEPKLSMYFFKIRKNMDHGAEIEHEFGAIWSTPSKETPFETIKI